MIRRFGWAGSALAIVLAPGVSFAREPKSDRVFEFGAGLDTQIGVAWLDAPAPAELTLPRSGSRAEIHDLSGLALGAGVFAEIRLLSRVGFHVGAAYALETMSGDLDVGDRTIHVELEHPALTVPLLLQGFVPLGAVAPFVTVGPELVVPIIPIARTDPERAFPVAATAETHLRLSLGAGVELRLPVTAIDLRVPLAVGGIWYAGLGDDLGQRVRVLPSDALIYTNTPRFGARASLGLGAYF